ncbi:MAG: hypothetical protein ACOYID_03980 [Eubacteriales bacterium]|jgi:hypothetical protein|nr:hypothetical protein [Clostridiales bacterium]
MNILDIDKLQALCDELERKNRLLKRISDSYSKALHLMEEQDYEALALELENQNAVFAKLSEPGCSLPVHESELSGIRGKALAYLSRCGSNKRLAAALKKTAENIDLYGRLLRNCKTLCEKLVFHASAKKADAERYISTAKNRRLVNAGYSTQIGPLKGTLVDFKSDR